MSSLYSLHTMRQALSNHLHASLSELLAVLVL